MLFIFCFAPSTLLFLLHINPWWMTARRLNQSILNEINPEYSLEGLALKLKLQYFGHLMWRADSLEKTLMLGKTGEEEKWATEEEMIRQHHQVNGHEFEQTPGDSEGQESLACCSPWGHKESDMTWWLNNNNDEWRWPYPSNIDLEKPVVFGIGQFWAQILAGFWLNSCGQQITSPSLNFLIFKIDQGISWQSSG